MSETKTEGAKTPQEEAFEQLSVTVAEQGEKISSLEAENKELKSTLSKITAAQSGEKAEQKKPELPPDPVFTVGKKKYRLVVAVMVIPGIGQRTAEEVLHDKAAQEKLVKIGAGVIKEEL